MWKDYCYELRYSLQYPVKTQLQLTLQSYRGCSWHPSRHELVNSLQRVINRETVGKSTETLYGKPNNKHWVSS